jgi:EmrB/QacA subfamily drug resistance transporter
MMPEDPPSPSPQIRRYLPWLVAIALFMENLDATIINTAVPTMAAQFSVAPLSIKSVLTSYTLSLAVFIPISGWMADRFGTRKVFLAAIGLFMVGSLLCGLSMNLPFLVASRILQGAGGAMMTPVGRLALVRSFPRSQMISMLNYVLIPALIGPLIGPFVGGVIVHSMNWRMIFLVNIPFAVLGLILVRKHMPDYRDGNVPALDAWGFLLFGAGAALLSYVLEVFGEHRLSGISIALLLGASAAFLGAYGWHARRRDSPLLDLSLFGVRTLRVGVVGGFVTRLGIGGMAFLLPVLYQVGLGYPAWQAGLLLMPQAAAAISMRILNKPLLARFGHKHVLLANTALLGGTILTFSRVGPSTPVLAIVGLSFLQGFLSSIQFTSANTLVYADIEDRVASKAGSLASTAQQLSLSFGVATASLVAAWFLGHAGQAGTVDALHHAFLTMGLFTLLSSLVFATLKREDGGRVSNYQALTDRPR